MRIGITYDLKSSSNGVPARADAPDDLYEEFDSPVTIEAISAELRGLGHEVTLLGDGRELLERLLADPPDLVFNFAEGQGVGRAREARVPAVLEMLGIPYTGSDPLTLAATLDKDCAKRLVASHGIMVPRDVLIHPEDDPREIINRHPVPVPAIIKPAWEGSSKGIRDKCLVTEAGELLSAVATLQRDYQQPILVEEFIQGDEITVGILGNASPIILGVMRVVPNFVTENFVYSLEVKRDFRRQVRYECPAPIPDNTMAVVREAAVRAYRCLGCRDVSRIDFRLRNGVPYFLEVNPLPGLNPESSDLVIMSEIVGWSYSQLIETILQSATERLSATGQLCMSAQSASSLARAGRLTWSD